MAKNIFNTVSFNNPNSSNFDLSHDVKLSLDMGLLVPTMCKEVIPGDRWNIGSESMLRFAPLVAPVMHRFRVFQHYFFVPVRLLWPNFYPWLFDVDTHVFPTMNVATNTTAPGTLADYLGMPSLTNPATINPLPFAAYQFIYNEYYRDQNLQAEVTYALSDGTNSQQGRTDIRRRAWKHDYFTAALPFAQRGGDVVIPLGTTAPVKGNFTADQAGSGGNITLGNAGRFNEGVGNVLTSKGGPTDGLYADLAEASGSTIRDLRNSLVLQEWLERNARSGVRAKEGLLAHFGVNVQDKRLDRPEFVYGTSSPVVVSEVLQTAEGTDPVGNMAGHGISVSQSGRKTYFAPEHGYMMCIMSVMPEPAYQQGIPRHFLKGASLDRYSYAWPTFQHIGEQEVYNAELYAEHAEPTGTFGYVPRYADYKYSPSTVHGDFKTTLNHWHNGRIFASDPDLNSDFIECNPDKRIFAVQDGHCIWAQVYHRIRVRRKLSMYSNPKI